MSDVCVSENFKTYSYKVVAVIIKGLVSIVENFACHRLRTVYGL